MKLTLPAAALLLTSTAAMAELAPQDVFERWQGFYAGFGATIDTSAPEVSGDTTRYANVTSQMNIAGNEARYNFDWIDMRQNADGSVDISFSPSGFATSFATSGSTTIESRITYDLGSLTIHAEGTPDDIRFSYDAPVITMHQAQNMPGVAATLTLALQGLQGQVRSQLSADDLITESGALEIASLSAKLAFEPENGAQTFVDFSNDTLVMNYDMSLQNRPIPAAPASMFIPNDLVFGYTATSGPARADIKQKTPRGSGQFSFTQSSGDVSMAFAEGAISYGVSANDTTFSLANIPAQPVDFSAALGRVDFGLTFPLQKSDSPSPFALAIALERLTLGAEIWDKIDPAATLSRTPASFAFSINGTAKLFVDLFDQTAVTALRGAPFELRSLSLEALSLDFEGMGLTGDGAVTFNNGRIDPMSGLPEPLGALDFSITGALGLLDKIGRLGFMDPMIIIGAKGALGMFATANNGPDSFTSRIEFTEGGHVSVNGQQIK